MEIKLSPKKHIVTAQDGHSAEKWSIVIRGKTKKPDQSQVREALLEVRLKDEQQVSRQKGQKGTPSRGIHLQKGPDVIGRMSVVGRLRMLSQGGRWGLDHQALAVHCGPTPDGTSLKDFRVPSSASVSPA